MSKKKYRTRQENYFLIFLMVSLLIAIITFGITNNTKVTIIFFFITLILCLAGYIVLCIPSVKGKIGEHKVSKQIKKLQKKHGGYIFNNVMIIDEDTNKSSQIDHIYLSKYGIFVFETKNYSGRIYGKDKDDKWTQVLLYGKQKNAFYNPVKQNYTHIIRLQKILGESNLSYKSVIVFTLNNIRFINSEYIVPLHQIKHLIKKQNNILLSEEKVNELFNKLTSYVNGISLTNKEHVKEIKQMVKDVNNNICPRCGSNLILRKSKDGNTFYGCSKYPKCTFTKKV